MLVAVAFSYATVLGTRGPAAARASAFTTLVVANVLLIMTSRSRTESALTLVLRPNAAFLAIVTGVLAALALVLYFPPAARLFQFGSPMASELAFAALLGAVSVLWFDVVKLVARRRAATR